MLGLAAAAFWSVAPSGRASAAPARQANARSGASGGQVRHAGASVGRAAATGHAASTIGPHKGILPPKNPSKSLPPSPDFVDSSSCYPGKDTTACNSLVLRAITKAREELEGLKKMHFSLVDFEKLTPEEQLFATVDLERLARSMPTVSELTTSLDTMAQKGAVHNEDPEETRQRLPGGGTVIDYGSNWATGADTPLGSDYYWMYDDGGKTNQDCTSTDKSGCWGHRDNILGTFATKGSCGREAFHTVMGAGYVKTGAVDGDGETELIVGVCGNEPTDTVITWTQVKKDIGAT